MSPPNFFFEVPKIIFGVLVARALVLYTVPGSTPIWMVFLFSSFCLNNIFKKFSRFIINVNSETILLF